MNDNQNSYVEINSIEDFGNFSVSRHQNSEPQTNYLLKKSIISNSNNEYEFIPGKISNGEFKSSPLKCFYVVIDRIFLKKHSYCNLSEATLKITVYDKNHLEFRKLTFLFSNEFRVFPEVNISEFGNLVNLLNEFVSQGENIYKIKSSNVKRNFFQRGGAFLQWKYINELEFEFYENSKNRVGKDNYFWVDVEVRKIPKNLYIREIIMNSLKNIAESQIIETEYGVTFKTDQTSGWSPSYHRKKIENCSAIDITDKLKYDLTTNYNLKSHIFSDLIS